MVVDMDKYYYNQSTQQSVLQQLCNEIHSLHLGYLNEEQGLQKLEHRNRLEECILKYLCCAPHKFKFHCPETAEVLHMSASRKDDFSGYKAALGFDAIGRYAENLIAQPWRKEYHQIKMYSGFYKHEIDSNLVGAEILFEAMGYRHVGNQILQLEGPVCPDRVSNVSKDSIIAYVECQIIKAIWEDVTSVYGISWLEVLKFREQSISDAKSSVNRLIAMYREKQYQRYIPEPVMCNGHHQVYHPMMPPVPNSCIYSNACCPTAYVPYVHHPHPHYVPSHINYAPQITKGYPVSHVPVPTAQLIDHSFDMTDAGTSTKCDTPPESKLAESGLTDSSKNKDAEGTGNFETWDYVYRNLKSKGYSKDLGERPDLTQTEQKSSSSKGSKDRKSGSYYDNIAATVVPQKAQPVKSGDGKHKEVSGTPLVVVKTVKPSDKWECLACTYLNSLDRVICEMCGKSKEQAKMKEMALGGPECAKCTYVNSKDRESCEMCGESLRNSATYI